MKGRRTQGGKPTRALAVCAVALSLSTAGPAMAIGSSWLAAGDGSWTDAANWSTANFPDNGSPNPGDTYDVNLDVAGSAYTVTLENADDVTISSLAIGVSDATLSVEHAHTTVSDEAGTTLLGHEVVIGSVGD